MKEAVLTIEIHIPDYELVLARARLWEKEYSYKYDDDELDQLITDYLMSDINKGYSVMDSDLDIKEVKWAWYYHKNL